VSPKSLFALGAAALTIASVAASAAPAYAEYEYDRVPYRACVAAGYGAWLFVYRCYGRHNRCVLPVRSGLAFRVERQKGGYLLVHNLQTRGWIELSSLRLVPQAYCRAAGLF
jgi:hypothetical protein